MSRHIIFALLLIAPVGFLATSALGVVEAYTSLPYQDQWDNIWWWREIIREGLRLEYLFSQHNEHRILFSRLVFLADLNWFSGNNILNLIAIAAIHIGGASAFVAAAGNRQRIISIAGLSAALCIIFSLPQWENLVWGFQVQFVAVYAFATWAIFAYCLGSFASGKSRTVYFAVAVTALALATFNMANGLLAGVAMIIVSLVGRHSWRLTAFALSATAFLGVVYFYDYHSVSAHAPFDLAIQHPDRYVLYVLAFLGSIWAFGQYDAAVVFGTLGALITCAMTFDVFLRQRPNRTDLVAFGIVVFVGMSAGVTALGRLNYGIEQALTSRYATPGSYFWAAQLLYWSQRVSLAAAPKAIRFAAAGVLLASIVLTSAVHYWSFPQLLEHRNRMRLAESALLAGISDQEVERSLYPDRTRVGELLPFMKAQHLSVFAKGELPGVGTRVEMPRLTRARCLGAFDVSEPRSADPSRQLVQGWGWDRVEGKPVQRVLLVADGRVVGLALGGVSRRDVPAALSDVTSNRTGWIGLVEAPHHTAISAYGLLSDGVACELGALMSASDTTEMLG